MKKTNKKAKMDKPEYKSSVQMAACQSAGNAPIAFQQLQAQVPTCGQNAAAYVNAYIAAN